MPLPNVIIFGTFKQQLMSNTVVNNFYIDIHSRTKTLQFENSWSSRCPIKEFLQKEWSRISLDPFVQK